MRMKKFTLLTLALLLMSVVAFAQKPSIPQLLQKRTATSVLPNSQKAPTPQLNFNLPAKSGVAKAPNKAAMIADWTLAGSYYDGWSETIYEYPVQVEFIDDQVTINNFSPLVGGSITGTMDGSTITFASPQLLGDYYGSNIYFSAYDLNTGSMAESVTAEYGENGITFPDDVIIVDNGREDQLYYWGYWSDLSIIPATEPDPVTPPAGLETAEYRLNAYAYDASGNDMGEYSLPLDIGWDNNDVWVQGLCQDFPEAWIKGTFADGSVTFAKGQKFDEYYMSGYGTIKDFFTGYDVEEYEMADVTMSFDQETGLFTMTSPYLMLINAYWITFDPNLLLEDVSFVPVPDEAATPAQPEITSATVKGSDPIIKVNIPIEDVDGNPILRGKLYYKYYYDVEREVSPLILSAANYRALLNIGEDMDEIPYNLVDYSWDLISNDHFYLWQEDCSNWNKVGIQSVYYGGDEENETEIFWYTIKPYENQHDIVFTPTEESDGTIQDGQAKVFIIGQDVNGNAIYEDATERVDAKGKLASIDENLNVILTPINGFKLANVTASYKEQPVGGASGELTVFDGTTTNSYVPVYGYYADAYLKSEFVMPASELADMAGQPINGMTFYAQQSSVNWGNAQFQVFLTEVADETISAFNGPGTVVYEGALGIVDGEMNIEFTTPYQYNGGNLLIGFYETATGSYVTSTWLGEQVNGASVQGYSYSSLDAISATQRNFLPKTTFVYGGGDPIDIEVTQDENGGFAFFTMPNAKVNVNYELVRLGTPVEVAAGKYITYYTDKDIVIYDEDCELLTVTAVDETTVTATPLEVAAAETPLLIYNSSDVKKELWIVPTEDTPYANVYEPDEIEVAPEFKGTLEEKTFTAAEMNAAEHFICDGENFIWVRSEGTIAANKCWLELTNDEPLTARAIVIGAAETTGISNVNANVNLNGNYYDLQGRRVMQPVKGLYISNGKKVMVK